MVAIQPYEPAGLPAPRIVQPLTVIECALTVQEVSDTLNCAVTVTRGVLANGVANATFADPPAVRFTVPLLISAPPLPGSP